MLYFAYGTPLSPALLQEWSRASGIETPRRVLVEPAVLRHHRLSFNHFDLSLASGIANVLPAPSKSVHGALIDVSARGLEALDALHEATGTLTRRRLAPRGWRKLVSVLPYRSIEPVQAITHQFDADPGGFAPPSRAYLERLLEATAAAGLNSIWLMHLSALASFIPDERPARRGAILTERPEAVLA